MSTHKESNSLSVMGRRWDSTRPVFFDAHAGVTLKTVVQDAIVKLQRDTVYTPAQARSLLRFARVRVDGVEIRRTAWATTRPKPGAHIEVLRTVHGGGGGGGKNAVALVAMVAIAVVAIYAAPAVVGAMGPTMGMGTTAFSVAGMGVTYGGIASFTGMMALNMAAQMIFAPSAPSLGGYSATDSGSESPTYSITGARNAANLYGYVPLVLGKHRHTPPLGAKSWTSWEGENQFFHMLVVWGHPDMVVSDFRIGETSLDEFTEVTHEFHQATKGDDLVLFAKSYSEQSVGVVLSEEGGWVTRTIGEAEEIVCDIAFQSGLTEISTSDGSRGDHTVEFEAQYREIGTSTWLDSGLGTIPVTRAQSTPAVESFRVDGLPRADYEMRIRRTTADSDSQYIYDEATWSVSRAVLNHAAFNTPVPICVSELRIRANDQITGYVDDFNALCSSELPTWDGTGWNTVAETANAAAQMRYLLTSRHSLSTPFTTAKLDDTSLATLYEWCVAEGLEFNFIADSEESTWARLTQVLSAARASATTDVDGLWGAAIDQPGKTPKQLFSPRNSWSFKVSRGFMELPHALRVSYVDEDDDYDQKEDFVYADSHDESTATNIVSWDYPGVTNWPDIWKMGRRHLAKLLHRQFSISINTDWEWLAVHRGDMVGVASDVLMNVFGTARIQRLIFEVDGEEVLVGREEDIPLDEYDEPLVPIGVQLDDTVIFSDPAPARYGIAIRDRSSALTTYEIVPEYGEERDVLHFTYALTKAQAPSLGTLCSVSILGEEYDEYLVSAISPSDNLTAELVLTPYVMDEIEASVSGEIPAFNGQSRLDVTKGTTLPAPTITNVRSDEGVLVRGADGTLLSRIMVNYSLGTGAVLPSTVQAQYRMEGDTAWTSAPSVIAGDPVIITGVEDGSVYDVRIRAVTVAGVASGWVEELGHTVVGKTTRPPDVEWLLASVTETGLHVEWAAVPVRDLAGYLLRMGGPGATWETATPVWSGLATNKTLPMQTAGDYTLLIRAVDAIGLESMNVATLAVSIDGPAAPAVIARVDLAEVVVEWTVPAADWPIVEYEVRHSDASLGRYKVTSHRVQDVQAGAHEFSVRAMDAAGNASGWGAVNMTVSAPSAVLVTQQVIDNNVLLYWSSPASGTFPVSHYIVRSGDTLETSMLLGTVDARFIAHFESQGGAYTYWVAAVDTSGNEGAFASVSATVSQPPDYVLLYDYDSPFGGATTRFVMEGGELVGPVFDETWQEHFIRGGQTTMQGFADSGFSLYLLPNATSATYVEEIDYGTVLSGSKITVTPTMQVLTGGPSTTCRIEVRETTGEAWRLVADDWQGYTTAFRYARVTVTVASGGYGAVRISGLNIRYDIKQRKEGGMATCLASHAGGTPVTFAGSYVDIQAITVTPKAGSAARYAIYDFVDEPNPTGFTIYLYNASGVRVDGEASWSIIGV
jgi:hypothetical protein